MVDTLKRFDICDFCVIVCFARVGSGAGNLRPCLAFSTFKSGTSLNVVVSSSSRF